MNENITGTLTSKLSDTRDGMTKQIVDLLVRHTFTLACGAMVRKGYMDQDDASIVIGAALGLAGVALSVYHKVREQKIEQLPPA